MDVSGEHELDVDHGIFKKRLNTDGTPAGEIAEVRSLGDKDVEIPMKSPGCGTCYGAEKVRKRLWINRGAGVCLVRCLSGS
jgi:endoplasmic reticulum-Golgi intermediate compartment protein 3